MGGACAGGEGERRPCPPHASIAVHVWALMQSRGGGTGVPRSKETTPPLDPTVGLRLGSYGSPRGGVLLLVSEAGRKVDYVWDANLTKDCRGVSCVERVGVDVVTSLTRDSAPLGPYNRTMPRALWRS